MVMAVHSLHMPQLHVIRLKLWLVMLLVMERLKVALIIPLLIPLHSDALINIFHMIGILCIFMLRQNVVKRDNIFLKVKLILKTKDYPWFFDTLFFPASLAD